MLFKVLAAAGAAALLAGAANAQSEATPANPAPSPGAPSTDTNAAPPPGPSAAPAPTSGDAGAAAAPAPTGGIPGAAGGPPASSATGAGAGTSPNNLGYNVNTGHVVQEAGPNGAQIITNGPIPDTRANRAEFGPPDSAAGRRTRPRGN